MILTVMAFFGKSALACGLLLAASPEAAPTKAPPGMVVAAQGFLTALRPDLRREAVLPFAAEERRDWHYVPRSRRGVSFQQMDAGERAAAHTLLRAGLSDRGYEKTTGVIALEAILREIETFGFRRDPELYWMTVFGAPSASALWGWRFEGHHLSLNFSAATGELVATTPSFFGANPATVPEGRPRAGWRLLRAEEDVARRLLASLDASQRGVAMISADAPREILMTPLREQPPPLAGLPYARMSAAQRELLLTLIGEYVGNLRPSIGQAQWQRIRGAGLEGIRFAWAGGAARGEGHYYRVHGPTFVIEYDNTQDGANHVHTVWRDLTNDFGDDLLARHYRESPHHADARARVAAGSGEGP